MKMKFKKHRKAPAKSDMSMTVCTGGFRINDGLLGRILAIKKTGDIYESTSNVNIKTTIDRPMDFGSNLFRWLVYIKSERKRLAEDLRIKETSEIENKLKIDEERNRKALKEKKKFLEEFFKPMA